MSDVPSPSQEYSDNYDFYRSGLGLWVNTNMTPDYPLAADAFWLTYEATTGEDVDGVMLADPFALKALMRVTDPIPVSGTGIELTDKNIVSFVSNRAYALFETNEQRKLVLGRVAQAVLAGFLAHGGDPQAKVRALLNAFDDGHVLAWSTDRRMQRGLALTTVGGAFDPSGTDAISVVTNSASGTKLDFYQERTVTYDVRLTGGGTATATLTVDMLNDSPTSGFPPYVIGPYKDYSTRAGENVAVVDLYCDRGCALQSATRGGEPVELSHYQMDGYPVLRGLRADGIGRHGEHHGRARADASVGGRRPGRHVPSELHPSDHDPADHRAGEHLGARRHAVHVVGRPALTRRGSPGLRGDALRRPGPGGVVRPAAPAPDLAKPHLSERPPPRPTPDMEEQAPKGLFRWISTAS